MALGNGVAEAPATHLKGALFALGSPPRGALLGTAQRHRARRPPAVCARCAVCPTPSPASAAATTRAPAGSITPPSPDAPPPAARRGARAETAAPQKKKGCERALEEPCGRESALQPCPAAWHAWSARAETPPWLYSPHRGAKPSRQGGYKGRPMVSTPSAASWWALLGGRGIRSVGCGIHRDQLCFPYACIVSRRDSTREKAPAAAAIGTDRRVSRLPPEFCRLEWWLAHSHHRNPWL